MDEQKDIQLYWKRIFQGDLDNSLKERVLERAAADADFKSNWLMERDEWIDKYLRVELSKNEFKHFLELMREDDDFYKTVSTHRAVFLALKNRT